MQRVLAPLLLALLASVAMPWASVAAAEPGHFAVAATPMSTSSIDVGDARLSVVLPGAPSAGARFNAATRDGAHVFVTTSFENAPDGRPLDAVAGRFLPVVAGKDGGVVEGATEDGTTIVLNSANQLTGDDTDIGPDLYLASPSGLELITVGPSSIKSTYWALSLDGTRVIFDSRASFQPSDTDATIDLYRWTAGSGDIELLTPDTASDVTFLGASDDGVRVIFRSSEALGGDPIIDGIYERTLGGFALRGASLFRSMSTDGSRVYSQSDVNLVQEDIYDERDVYLSTDQGFTLLSPAQDGGASLGGVTPDGDRWLISTTAKLTPDDLDDTGDSYMFGAPGGPELVTAGAIDAGAHLLSDDGRFVVYTTQAALSPSDTDSDYDEYLWDALDPSSPTLVTTPGNERVEAVAMTDDGSTVVLNGPGRLLPADTDIWDDIYVWRDGVITLLTPGSPSSLDLKFVSDDARRIIFETGASLVPEDLNSTFDAYVADLDLEPPIPTLSSIPPYTTSTSATFAAGTVDGDEVWLDARMDGGVWVHTTSSIELTDLALGLHTLELHAYDAAANRSASPAVRTWTISATPDTVAPTATAPSRRLLTGTSINAGKTVVRQWWIGSDALSGIARYEVGQSTDGGAWTTVSTVLTSPTLDRPLAPGHTYRFRVRAVDNADNVGAWAYGSIFSLSRYSETSSRIRYSGTWTLTRSSVFWGGQAKRSSSTGASLRQGAGIRQRRIEGDRRPVRDDLSEPARRVDLQLVDRGQPDDHHQGPGDCRPAEGRSGRDRGGQLGAVPSEAARGPNTVMYAAAP
jgi:hypothetical protein